LKKYLIPITEAVVFSKYAFIGGLGFFIDFLIYYALRLLTGSDFLSRFVSYGLATFSTWVLNTKHTFKYSSHDRFTGRHFLRYALSQLPAISVNLIIHHAMITFFGSGVTVILVIYGINGVTALIINFSLSKLFVFKTKTHMGQR